MTALNITSIQPNQGSGMEFTTAAAVVIGGTSLYGGKGSILPGTLLGVLLLSIIDNIVVVMGFDVMINPFIKGIIIIVAMYFDALGTRFRKK